MAQRKPNPRRGVSIEHLWPLAVLAGIFAFLSLHPIRPHDFWWHLKAGQQIVTMRAIPIADTFSYTMAGAPYPNYAAYWLMESAYYLLFTAGGPALVIFVHSVAVAGAYAVLLWLCYRVSGSWRVAALSTLFAAALGFDAWNVRPQAIAYPLGSLYLWIIYGYRGADGDAAEERHPSPWLLIGLPLGMVLWANSHGSFVIGLLMLVIWLIDAAGKRLAAGLMPREAKASAKLGLPLVALGVSGLACLLNPRGAGILAYLRDLSGNPVIRGMVPEWASPSFESRSGALFLGGLLACAVVLAVTPRRPALYHLLAFVAFGALGLSTSRGIPWFGMVMAPVLAAHLPAIAAQARTKWARSVALALPAFREAETPRQARGKTALNATIAALLSVGVVLSLPWFKHALPLPAAKAGLISGETPVEATRVLLREHPDGRLFHALPFGSYLIWAAQPDYPVFVDTRLELYPLELWVRYLDISAARCDWDRQLQEYGVNILLLSPDDQPLLVRAAEDSPAWRLVYRDPAAVLFVRQAPER